MSKISAQSSIDGGTPDLSLKAAEQWERSRASRHAASLLRTQKPLKGWYLSRPARLSGDAGVCGRRVRPEAHSGGGVGWNGAVGTNRRNPDFPLFRLSADSGTLKRRQFTAERRKHRCTLYGHVLLSLHSFLTYRQ